MIKLVRRLCAVFMILVLAAPAHAEWHEARSKHFIIYADLKPDALRQYAERLERFDSAVRLVRGGKDPPLTDAERLTVYALPDVRSIGRLAGAQGVAGFYNGSAHGAFMFAPIVAGIRADRSDLSADAIFFHEYAHHLQLREASAALPGWFTEGFAEFFATARIEKDGSVLIGAPPGYRPIDVDSFHGLDIEKLLGGTPDNAFDISTHYGVGWLLTHYLTFSESRRGQLERYLDGIQRGTPALESARLAFGDLRALHRELSKYLDGKVKAVRIPAAALTVAPVSVRKLGPGQSAMMDVVIRSHRGVDKKSAPQVARDAREAAAPFASDPVVQAALAEAEFDAEQYAAAEAAAGRALAADPNNIHALIYKGRSRLELARLDAAKADWAEIRTWFSKANRVDVQHAEPLQLFYESYVAAGQAPTANAVEGLLFAVELAPRDPGLRRTAVRQLLVDNRLPEAREMFAPIAFAPHSTEKSREANDKIMDAIVAGNRDQALSLLDARIAELEKESEE